MSLIQTWTPVHAHASSSVTIQPSTLCRPMPPGGWGDDRKFGENRWENKLTADEVCGRTIGLGNVEVEKAKTVGLADELPWVL